LNVDDKALVEPQFVVLRIVAAFITTRVPPIKKRLAEDAMHMLETKDETA
jgi:hypothetical protein